MKNEEDIKLKVVYPLLEGLGYTKDEVIFENKFEFRLGTNIFKVGKGKSKKALGFSDILCKKDNRNIFVIEVKDQDIEISEADADQAISYARLVHPIAPFSIVTNGKCTKIYDTITKKDLTGTKISESSEYWANGLEISLEEELRQRFLAIQNFIGYSEENIIAFSKSQVDSRISTLKGDKNNISKKYIPELYLSNSKLETQFDNFIYSSSQLFAIIGESGVGKSNTICYLSEKSMCKHIVFFFNGTELTKSIIPSLKEDCNWFFSPNLEDEEVLAKLLSLTDDERKLIIFIDAIDEVITSYFVLELNELAKKIKKYPNIKICVSCKSNEWPSFISIKGNPSSILDIIYSESKGDIDSSKQPSDKYLEHGILLYRFDNKEIDELDLLYRAVFHYKGDLNPELKSELRLGFTFRTFATVYENKDIPQNLNDVVLFDEYLKKSLEKIDYEKAYNYLAMVANAIFEANHNLSSNNLSPGFVDEQNLRKQLNLGINENIYPELFAYNILSRIPLSDGSTSIGFYYGRLRNYIIATRVLKLHLLTDDQFKSVLDKLIVNSIGQETLLWYYHSSCFRHHIIFKNYYFNNALIFVTEYEKIINKHLFAIKNKFEPYTKNAIGLIVEDHISEGLKSFSLYPINKESDQKIKVLPPEVANNLFSIVDIYHGSSIHSDRDGFLISYPEKKAKDLIIKQLEEIIKKGELSETGNEGILKEKVLAMIHEYHSNLEFDIKTFGNFVINFGNIFPINLDNILNKIRYKEAQRYYEELEIQELIQSGKIPIANNGEFVTYSVNRSLLDFNSINRKAKDAVDRNLYVPSPEIHGNVPPFKALKNSINDLKRYSLEISTPLLPSPDTDRKDINNNLITRGGRRGLIPDLVIAQFSDKKLAEYTNAFFLLFLSEYKTFIENNFSGLEKKFELYSNLPVQIHCEINTLGSWELTYGIKKTLGKSKVTVELNPTEGMLSRKDSDYYSIHGSSLVSLIWNSNPTKIDRYIHGEKASGLCGLRNFIYNWVNTELDKTKLFD